MLKEAFKLMVVILTLLSSSAAYAAYDKDNPPDLFCDAGRTAGSNPAFGGKPVSLYSGMETFAPSVDLTLGNLFPIRITRSYNSITTYDSPLGYGWAINYDKRLYSYPDHTASVRRECGKKNRFTWTAPGGYAGQTGDTGTLVQNTTDGTFTYTDQYGAVEKYDADGKLTDMVDTKGNSLHFTYTGTTRDFLWGLLPFNLNQDSSTITAYDYHLSKIEERDASGQPTNVYVNFVYNNATGRLTGLSDSNSRSVSYGHDGIGNLTSAAGPIENSTPVWSSTYEYTDSNNKHLLTSIDEGSGAYVNEYDSKGRVKKQTHGTGEIDFDYTFPYHTTTMTTSIRDASGNLLNTSTKTVWFYPNGTVEYATDTFGNVTTYFLYGSTTWVMQERHTDIATGDMAATAYNDYDTKGNARSINEMLGTTIVKTTAYAYDPTYGTVKTETVKSVVNQYQTRVTTNTYYDGTGNLYTTNETGLLGDGTGYSYTTTYTYDANGRVQTIDGPRTDVSDITSYTYDPLTGAVATITQPIIGTTTYSNFNSLGNPQTVTDPNGNSTTYTYDTVGRVKTARAPGDSAATQYFYLGGGCSSCGGANKIDHIILPEGNTVHYHYDDGLGNLTSIVDDAGNSINYTYDSERNKLTEQIKNPSGALQKTVSYEYDALNRLTKINNPDPSNPNVVASFTLYGYDGFGNRTSIQNPNTAITNYPTDALGRLTSVTQPGNITTIYGYNPNKNLTSVKDANDNITTYVYDDKGRVYRTISPDTGTTTYGYDPAGNMISKTDAKGVTISYVYDALNRLTWINFPSNTDTEYTYDTCVNGKGRLCSMTDASGSTAYAYSAKGQVTTETKTFTGITGSYITRYTYDQNGNIKTMTYPSGKVITYNYTNDKVTSVQNGAAYLANNISYKPFGGISGLTYGNNLIGAIGYDNQYRITSITAGAIMSLNYDQYDANGNIQHITNTLDTARNKTFGYDALDRLTSGTGSWGSLGWTYDGVGNRQTEGSTVYSYVQGTNKLSGVGGLTYSFDNDGNTTADGTRGYTYSQNQRLIQAVQGSTTATYKYNGNGQRAKKVVGSTTTIYHYSQAGQLIAESNSAGEYSAEYVYLNGQPLAKIAGANTYYYHNDHLGTPQKLTDSSGAVVWSADYKPFGEATVTVSTITNNLRFPGQYYDAETGLLYNYFRDLNPATGRYIESDLIGIQRSRNHLYVYAENNPLRWTDPRGLCTQCDQCPSGKYHYEGVEYGGFVFVTGVHSSTLKVTCMDKPQVSFSITMTCIQVGGGLGASINTPVGLSFGCNNKAAENAILGWSWWGSMYPNPFGVPTPGFGFGVHGSGSLGSGGYNPGWGAEASAGGGYCFKVN